MTFWAGIDEAGYGPRLGPLVVAGSSFTVGSALEHGMLWRVLRDAVSRDIKHSDGRIVVNDSKKLYSPAKGLHRLEESVLAFLMAWSGATIPTVGDLVALLEADAESGDEPTPWFAEARGMALPVAGNLSSVVGKAEALRKVCGSAGVRILGARAAVVFAPEFNRIVSLTRNKSLLLFQKCGLILRELWGGAGGETGCVLVDKHGGRMHYRRLLKDVFPACPCDIKREEPPASDYVITGRQGVLTVSFRERGDSLALPTALGSMIAKYLRELHMRAFNDYWRRHREGLKPTAGYSPDATRYLREIHPVIQAQQVDLSALVRMS
jgi:hypothetical protein